LADPKLIAEALINPQGAMTANPLIIAKALRQQKPKVDANAPQSWSEYGQNFMTNMQKNFPTDPRDPGFDAAIKQAAMDWAPMGMVSKASTLDELKAIRDKWEARGVTLSAYGKGSVNLGKIEVPKELRGQGVGTEAMADLVSYADRNGVRLTLSPTSEFGGSKERLRAWYKSMGFVDNKGSNKDFTVSESMYRPPKIIGRE
jgi:GNAT superfamily N-acetyltransferase